MPMMLSEKTREKTKSLRFGDGTVAAENASKHVKVIHYVEGTGTWPEKYKNSRSPISSPPRTRESFEALEVHVPANSTVHHRRQSLWPPFIAAAVCR